MGELFFGAPCRILDEYASVVCSLNQCELSIVFLGLQIGLQNESINVLIVKLKHWQTTEETLLTMKSMVYV